MNDERQVYVNANLTVTLHGPDKPTWIPSHVPAEEVMAAAMGAKELHVRREGEMDTVILAVSPLIRRAKAAAK